MSRTYKDKPYKLRYGSWNQDWMRLPYLKVYIPWGETEEKAVSSFYGLQLPTTKPKLRKEVDSEGHWMSTPSWWNNTYHTRPKRAKFRNFTSDTVKLSLDAIEDVIEPVDSNKPHCYFW